MPRYNSGEITNMWVHFSVWLFRPIPPEGYVSVGDVAANTHLINRDTEDPATCAHFKDVRCVRADLVGQAIPAQNLWDDSTTKTQCLAPVSLWRLKPDNTQTKGMDIGVFMVSQARDETGFGVRPLCIRMQD
eukprot:comp21432_c0_seq2/m.29556 comp21432_c0_seq2/g.29556  ORF comp21432_c0_seq2/g.29556 comp21432_c0_seq2/m.29556 type:complete len:132 (-) comp21432_c0_seq2:465-860(-)